MGGTVCVSICVCALTSGSKGSKFLHPGQQESFSVGYCEVIHYRVQVYGNGLQWLVTTSEISTSPITHLKD